MANDLLVRILGDTKGLERSFAQANRATSKFGNDVQSVGTKADKATRSLKGFAGGAALGFGGGLITQEVLGQMKAAIDVASSLQEQISASEVVFESSAKTIQKWSETTADSIGVAQDQALLAANTFGSIFDAAGRNSAEAARLSQAVVQLGGDLASFADTSVDDALLALRSGLSGEIEPLRRFRVFLTEAAVAQEAMAQSGKKSSKELTQGEKIMARWTLILRQTTKAQGDAERTSESYANQTRQLSANARNLQADLGQLLLPAVTNLVDTMGDGVEFAQLLADNLKALGRIQIPPIKIPFVMELPGGRVGGFVGSALGRFAKLAVLGIGPTVALEIKHAFFDGKDDIEDAIDQGVQDYANLVKQIPEKFKRAVQGQGFGTFAPGVVSNIIGQAIEDFTKAATKQANAAVAEGNRRIKAQTAAEKRETFFDNLIASLELNVDRAEITATLRDDLAALEALASGLRRQINAGQDVAAAQRQLVQVEGDIAETAKQMGQNRRAAADALEQARQFRALGLSATGDEIVPGFQNLAKRVAGVLRRIDSGDLDVGSKMAERFKLAAAVIKKEGKNMTEATRSVINDWLKAVSQGQDKVTGPLTKTSSLNANKLIESLGLSLSPEDERKLRAGLSSFNTARQRLAAGGNRPTGQFVGGPVTVESNVTVELDGERVSRTVTRSQQKQRRRNPKQKRGPNSGV